EVVNPGPAAEDVPARAADQCVIAPTTHENTAQHAAGEDVVARAADDVAEIGNAGQTRGDAGCEVDVHAGGVGGVIQRVDPPAAVDGDRGCEIGASETERFVCGAAENGNGRVRAEEP